jgi:hypothetical protein
MGLHQGFKLSAADQRLTVRPALYLNPEVSQKTTSCRALRQRCGDLGDLVICEVRWAHSIIYAIRQPIPVDGE